MGLWFAGQNVKHLKHVLSEIMGLSGSQINTSETSTNALSEMLGLWFAEQHVGNVNTCPFKKYGTPFAEQSVENVKEKLHF